MVLTIDRTDLKWTNQIIKQRVLFKTPHQLTSNETIFLDYLPTPTRTRLRIIIWALKSLHIYITYLCALSSTKRVSRRGERNLVQN